VVREQPERDDVNHMLFRFYCDESYDGNSLRPDALTISGFFSDEATWAEIERQWSDVNARYSVQCFHATALNHGKEEYEGWPKEKRVGYSAELLAILTDQGKRLVAYNCGIRSDAYRQIISDEGQRKLGSPWFVCFKSCIAMVARHMETLPVADSFSVIVETGSGFDKMAMEFFDRLAKNPNFPYRHRLGTCAAAKPDTAAGLQVADLMAYEYFRRLQRAGKEMRRPLEIIRNSSNYAEGFFGENTLERMKAGIESAHCGDGELVVIPEL
jgi:hypothetical protein